MVEDWKKKFIVTLQNYFVAWIRRELVRERPRPGNNACQLVDTSAEIQSRKVGGIYALRLGNSCENILEFVSEAISN